jgi:hypothetical protein
MTKQELHWVGRELALNEILVPTHFGEDGPGYRLECTRLFDIGAQNYASGDFRDFALDELWAGDYLDDEPEAP